MIVADLRNDRGGMGTIITADDSGAQRVTAVRGEIIGF